jgi:hypothetical protein
VIPLIITIKKRTKVITTKKRTKVIKNNMKRIIYLGVFTKTMNQSLVFLKITRWC